MTWSMLEDPVAGRISRHVGDLLIPKSLHDGLSERNKLPVRMILVVNIVWRKCSISPDGVSALVTP